MFRVCVCVLDDEIRIPKGAVEYAVTLLWFGNFLVARDHQNMEFGAQNLNFVKLYFHVYSKN